MSAGAYINKIRVRAQARIVKVQYPGGRATNFNPLYSSISCNPDYRTLNYRSIPPCCILPVNGVPLPDCPPPPDCSTVDAGNSRTENLCIIDGGSSATSDLIFIGGGGAFGELCDTCIPYENEIMFGGDSTPAMGCIFDGGTSSPQVGQILNGGNS